MPEWLQITAAAISIIASLFGLCGISIYINERVKHRASKKNEQEDKEQEAIENAKNEHYKQILIQAISDKIDPLENELYEVRDDIKKLKAGVQASNRADLQVLVDKAEDQKWLSQYDKHRFYQLYQAYHNLGKNGVMDAYKEKILALPDVPPKQEKTKE